jgi:hypothetical protein
MTTSYTGDAIIPWVSALGCIVRRPRWQLLSRVPFGVRFRAPPPSQSDAQSCDGTRSGSLSPPRVQSSAMEVPVPSDKQALLAGLKAQSKARRTWWHSFVGTSASLTPLRAAATCCSGWPLGCQSRAPHPPLGTTPGRPPSGGPRSTAWCASPVGGPRVGRTALTASLGLTGAVPGDGPRRWQRPPGRHALLRAPRGPRQSARGSGSVTTHCVECAHPTSPSRLAAPPRRRLGPRVCAALEQQPAPGPGR